MKDFNYYAGEGLEAPTHTNFTEVELFDTGVQLKLTLNEYRQRKRELDALYPDHLTRTKSRESDFRAASTAHHRAIAARHDEFKTDKAAELDMDMNKFEALYAVVKDVLAEHGHEYRNADRYEAIDGIIDRITSTFSISLK